MSDRLTHLDEQGRAHMVDIGAKDVTHRICVARCEVRMAAETLARISEGRVAKGDVLATARIAGIQAAKRTHELIPLCHLLALSKVTVDFELDEAGRCVNVTALCRLSGQTGVEMEAMTATMAALLTLYDMVKAIDRSAEIGSVRLLEKHGGKSGSWTRD